MRISCNWLKRHVDLDGVDLDDLGRRFTMAVAELDDIEHVGRGLDRVVVGHVQDVQPLDGKKVRLTTVDCGEHGVRSIICGAANVAAGQFVAVALPGQVLGDMTIAVAEVAGVESSGMICSERELGLSDEHAGILVLTEADSAELAPGRRLDSLFPVADTIFVIDNKSLTHRPDCWGHRGIAREVAALLGRPLRPMPPAPAYGDAAPLTITVADPADCPRYCAVSLSGVRIGPSPLWLRMALSRAGTRPISNAVDATNFVMLDLGNPLHAFDARALSSQRIAVRRATEGEVFTTLDGQARTLTAEDVVITDGTTPTALAGIMGGLDSEIQPDTTGIVLEAAAFDAARVRMTGQRLGLRTESSARFEKSLDPRLPVEAAAAFCNLLAELCPELSITSALQDVAAPLPAPTRVETRLSYIRERLGHPIDDATILGILARLEFEVRRDGEDILEVTVPSYRATKDVGIPEDLVEEVGRVFGYDNIPPKAPEVLLTRPEPNTRKRFERATRAHLSLAAGLDELQSYSFDDEPFVQRLGLSYGPREALRNPISGDMPHMRRSLDSHLLLAIEKNARNFAEIGVYELGRVFIPGEGELPEQPTMLGLAIAGAPAFAVGVDGRKDPSRTTARYFMRLKGILLGLGRALERAELRFERGGVEAAWAHPVRQATIFCGDTRLGVIAELHPRLLKALDVTQHGALAELDLDLWRSLAVAPVGYRALPRFPAVYRDFAMVVPREVQASRLADAIREAAPELVEAVAFQSVYEGRGVDEGFKSVAWSVTLRRPERTLREEDIRGAEEAIWARVAEVAGARPRA